MKDRISELVEILNTANYNYNVLDRPTITDQEYDKYLRELINLEERYPELKGKIHQRFVLVEKLSIVLIRLFMKYQ